MAAQEGETDPLDRQCLDALSALNKAMLQLSLYEASHPSVTERLTECAEHLGRAIESSPPDGLVFAQDRDRWLANGRIIGLAAQVGGPLAALIARFKLDSVTFKPGLTSAELTALCELAATRPDQVTDYKAFLGERGVERVRFNEALYAKVDGLLPPGLAPGTGAAWAKAAARTGPPGRAAREAGMGRAREPAAARRAPGEPARARAPGRGAAEAARPRSRRGPRRKAPPSARASRDEASRSPCSCSSARR